MHLLPVRRGRDHLDRAALLGQDQGVDAQRLPTEAVVGFAVVSSIRDQLVEAHHLGRGARQRDQIGKIARWSGPNTLRQEHLRPNPHGQRPLQSAALTALALGAPLEIPRGMGEPQPRAVQGDLAPLSIASDAAHRLGESGGHQFRTEPAPGEPPERGVIGDAQEAEQAAQRSGDPQQILQAAVVQVQVLLNEQSGQEAGGAVGRTGVLAQTHGKRAARHSVGEPRKAQQLVFHGAHQVGITPSGRQAFDRARNSKAHHNGDDRAREVGEDGHHLLAAVWADEAPDWLRRLPAVEILRRIWIQQFYLCDAGVRWRGPGRATPPRRCPSALPTMWMPATGASGR